MSKWEVYYNETVTKKVVVEANDRITATQRAMLSPQHHLGEPEVIKKASNKKQFLTANKIED